MNKNQIWRMMLVCLLVSMISSKAEEVPIGRIVFMVQRRWIVDFRNDGSVNIQFGSSGGDDANTSTKSFNLEQLLQMIRPHMHAITENAAMPKEGWPVQVSVHYTDQVHTATMYLDNNGVAVARELFRHALSKAYANNPKYFDSLQKGLPILGIRGISVKSLAEARANQ